MQVKNNLNNASFCGNTEILYNLGRALSEAQYMASRELAPKSSMGRSEVDAELASVRAYIDSATQDSAFRDFVDSFDQHLQAPTKSKPGGVSKNDTLPEISNLTEYFGADDDLRVRIRGFEIFKEEFLYKVRGKMLYGKDSSMKKFRAFLSAIQPSIKFEEISDKLRKSLMSK